MAAGFPKISKPILKGKDRLQKSASIVVNSRPTLMINSTTNRLKRSTAAQPQTTTGHRGRLLQRRNTRAMWRTKIFWSPPALVRLSTVVNAGNRALFTPKLSSASWKLMQWLAFAKNVHMHVAVHCFRTRPLSMTTLWFGKEYPVHLIWKLHIMQANMPDLSRVVSSVAICNHWFRRTMKSWWP